MANVKAKINGVWENISLNTPIDNTPTQDSPNAVASGGVYTAISNIETDVDGKADASVGVSVTLAVADWTSSGDVYTQTVSAQGVTSSNNILVAPSPANFSAYGDAGIYCSAQSTNSLTFMASAIPSESVTANILIVG